MAVTYATFIDEIIAKVKKLEEYIQQFPRHEAEKYLQQEVEDNRIFGYVNNLVNKKLKRLTYMDMLQVKDYLLKEKKCKSCHVISLNCKDYAKYYLDTYNGQLITRKLICNKYMHRYYTAELEYILKHSKDENKLVRSLTKKFNLKVDTSTTEKFLESFLHNVNLYEKEEVLDYLKGEIMAYSYNRVTLLGRLTKDPEIRLAANGNGYAVSTMAVDSGKKNENGEYEADFFRIKVFGQKANIFEKYLKKGDLVLIEGKLSSNSWQDEKNEWHNITEVIVLNFVFMPNKKNETSSNGDVLEDPENLDIANDDFPQFFPLDETTK
ncbi:single-stranded DNA-binding protein [Marinitoga lauensis]|uniref:single-stranded DNA-binding protein n=1 Tax=Marinitoga lauensis TaxID=2201189 RepID=UPI0010113AEF|nr:single-stranded DNA-binding protein [Marinitoga lauensis]